MERKAGTLAALFVLALVLADPTSGGAREMQMRERVVGLEGAEAVEIVLKAPVVELELSGGSAALMEAEFEYPDEWEPEIDYRVDDGRGILSVLQTGDGEWDSDGEGKWHTGINWNSNRDSNEWELKLGGSVPLDLALEVGAIDGDLDLRGLRLEGLNMKVGAGDLDMDLRGDWIGDVEARIEVGVGDLDLKLPGDIGIAVAVESGIGDIDMDDLVKTEGEAVEESGGFRIPFLGLEIKTDKGGWLDQHFGQSGVWTNEAYGEADTNLRLHIKMGVGQLDVEVAN